MKRQVFYSFHYEYDNWRVSQIRNIGVIESNREATDNDWEKITGGGEASIKKWINDQMYYRSCTVVLVGYATAGRKWINYEIEKSWNSKMGIVGICIHKLKNRMGFQTNQGNNPFLNFNINGTNLSNIVKLYNPPFLDSKDVYKYIADNIGDWTNEAVTIRNRYS